MQRLIQQAPPGTVIHQKPGQPPSLRLPNGQILTPHPIPVRIFLKLSLFLKVLSSDESPSSDDAVASSSTGKWSQCPGKSSEATTASRTKWGSKSRSRRIAQSISEAASGHDSEIIDASCCDDHDSAFAYEPHQLHIADFGPESRSDWNGAEGVQ